MLEVSQGFRGFMDLLKEKIVELFQLGERSHARSLVEYLVRDRAFARTHRSPGVLQKQFASFYGNFMSVLRTNRISCVV